jgi:hypothetical protein
MATETSLLSRHFSSHEPLEHGSAMPRENVLTSSDKILGFKRKMKLWKNHVVRGNLEMLPLLLRLESEEGYQHISSPIRNHIEELKNKIKPYFSSLSTQVYD